MRRLFLVLALLAACSDDGGGGTEVKGRGSSSELTTTVAAGLTVAEVREAAFGTNVCFTDPACPVVVAVRDGGIVQVETTLFRDSEAGPVGQGLCVVVTQLTDKHVQVLGTDGGVIASGQVGDVPLCKPAV